MGAMSATAKRNAARCIPVSELPVGRQRGKSISQRNPNTSFLVFTDGKHIGREGIMVLFPYDFPSRIAYCRTSERFRMTHNLFFESIKYARKGHHLPSGKLSYHHLYHNWQYRARSASTNSPHSRTKIFTKGSSKRSKMDDKLLKAAFSG